MPNTRLIRVVELIHRRRARRDQARRRASRRLLAAGALLLGVFSVALATALLFAPQAYAYLTRDLPAVETVAQLFDPAAGALLQPTIFYDATGNEIWRLESPAYPRRFIDIQQAPVLANALTASRQPDYWNRPSLNLQAFDAPPTIAEELVQDFLFGQTGGGWLHTLRVRLLAAQLTEQYGRAQVLSWYANSRVFGHHTVGVEAASLLFFGKPAAQLTLAEATTLAPVAAAPALNPIDAPELAQQRQQALLLEMLDQGIIDEAIATAALLETVSIQPAPEPPIHTAPDFTQLTLEQAQALLGFTAVQRGGLAVHTSLDSVLQSELEGRLAELPGAVGLILDAATGQILAVSGQGDMAALPASAALSPFVYLSAFAHGESPADLAWDAPGITPFSLLNYEFKGPVSLREALANDMLAVHLQILEEVGIENAWSAARQAGMQDLNDLGMRAFAVDLGRVSLLEVAQAYATLANLGALRGQAIVGGQISPSALAQISGLTANDELQAGQVASRQVFDAGLAYLITDVLGDASSRQDASQRAALQSAGRPAGLHISGEWAIAYSPQRVIALWLPDAVEPAATLATISQTAHRGLPIETWDVPPGLISTVVCVPGGGLPGPDCPQTRRELFLPGSAPTAADKLYQRVAVNRLSGNLATVFTAPEYLVERLFLDVPPSLREWAISRGLAVAPQDFDSVLLPGGAQATTSLLSPAPFSYVAGTLSIEGRAGGEDFASYQLAVGRGLRPSQWLELGPPSANPVEDGKLAEWDTSGQDGLYAIRLQVRRGDGTLETAYTLVTVDNQSPELRLGSSLAGHRAGQEFVIRFEASDNYLVSTMEVFINGELAGRVQSPPYQISAQLSAGTYRLWAVAYDGAGNPTTIERDFEVLP